MGGGYVCCVHVQKDNVDGICVGVRCHARLGWQLLGV